MIRLLILSILLFGLIYPQQFSLNSYRTNNSCPEMSINGLEGIIGVMVQFDKEDPDDLRTSGDGEFITLEPSIDDPYPSFINYDDISRCSKSLLESPPHNSSYFESQLKSVINYYRTISNNQIFSDEYPRYEMIDEVYNAEEKMEYYARSENRLVELYTETILQASDRIINIAENIESKNGKGWKNNEFIIVVFHAGLGQDLGSSGFDPTIYDIHSAYIDPDMLGSSIEIESNSEGTKITRTISNGILLPETLNPIYYDVIEDMYSPSFTDEEDLEDVYCYHQTGMTGLFAYLLGYRLCMPPMHSTDNIYPVVRIGRFGLMDYGAYNRHGLIPAPPNIWTRTKHQQLLSNQAINITNDIFENYDEGITLTIGSNLDDIYRIDITNDEYFLIEHRSNLIFEDDNLNRYSLDGVMDHLDCEFECDPDIQDNLRLFFSEHLKDISQNYKTYWLDIMKIIYAGNTDFIIENNVIVSFPNYDHGLPGSGILIWHIKEPSDGLYDGINNDRYNKAITLEEGDGMFHLGFYDPDPFGSPIPEGWANDFWYNNNRLYRDVNNVDDEDYIYFNKTSIPNSNTSSGTESNIAIKILSNKNDDDMQVNFKLASNHIRPIANLDKNIEKFRYLGNNGDGVIYYEVYNVDNNQRIYYSQNLSDGNLEILEEFNDDCSKNEGNIDIEDADDMILYYLDNNTEVLCLVDDSSYYFVENDVASPIISPRGYFDKQNLNGNSNQPINDDTNSNYALGDFDHDGLDEIVIVSNGSLNVQKKDTGLIQSGFPLYNDFIGFPLIADIYGDDEPEIICKTNGSILVVSNSGDVLDRLPLYDLNHNIVLIPDKSNDKTYLVNGNRLYEFDKYKSSTAFWMNPYSTTYNYPLSGVDVSIRSSLQEDWETVMSDSDYGIDISRAFNYPNPFQDETTFRFFVGSSNSIQIKIYSVAGFLVDELQMNTVEYQYNEYSYDTSKLNPGVYFADMKSDKNESKLIKILKTK